MDNPSQIVKDVKSLQHQLKEALGKDGKDPYDKEVEFRRQSLRRLYIRLLLTHPYARESKDADTHLWMQTSYQFITTFKQRISSAERAAAPPPRAHGRHQHNGHGATGPVELRKLISRFRQFLAEEEKFWTQLLVRLSRSFALDELKPALVAMSILPSDESLSEDAPTSPRKSNPVTRNHFPEEGDPTPPKEDQRPGRLAIAGKMLVCLGDIARYREQYNESGGRPRAGHEEGAPRRGMRDSARPRNYERAQQYYEQARSLVPDEGNASHQLAILASYQKDTFGSLFHYYRALCVRQPYETAAENLNNILSKALEHFKAKQANGKAEPDLGAARHRVDTFKSQIVILHALWRVDVEEMDRISPEHSEHVADAFSALVAERILPSDMITKVIVLALGALWKHRTVRDSTSATGKMSAARRNAIEGRIAGHIIDLFRVLLVTGGRELSENAEEGAPAGLRDDLAQQITATFRRTLGSLRIFSKWCRANFNYITSRTLPAPFPESTKAFWTSYIDFWSSLQSRFPRDQLPPLSGPLDEDVEMSGFSPLKRQMFDPCRVTQNGLTPGQSQVHPNEEQLMRIADLLEDAQLLAEMKDSPIASAVQAIVIQSGQANQGTPAANAMECVTAPDVSSVEAVVAVQDLPIAAKDAEDDNMTVASVTTDDPVGDAFRTALDNAPDDEDVEEEDEIIWNPRASTSPPLAAIAPPQQMKTPPALTPIRPPYSPIRGVSSQTQGGEATASPTKGATAQDLLASIMGPRSPGDYIRHQHQRHHSVTPQAPLLFGQGSANSPIHSIWSTAGLQGQSNTLNGSPLGGGGIKQPFAGHPQAPFSQPTQTTQASIWSSGPSYSQPSSDPRAAFIANDVYAQVQGPSHVPLSLPSTYHGLSLQQQPQPQPQSLSEPLFRTTPLTSTNFASGGGFAPISPARRASFHHTRGYSSANLNTDMNGTLTEGSSMQVDLPKRPYAMPFAQTWAQP